jgi:sec-independent protein translocase protein TatB
MDFSWSELMVVGIVALIIIGPKDLPGMFRELGRFTAKVRAMGREFSRAMEQAAKESGVKDVADDLKKATSAKAMGLDAVRSAADKFEKWDPLKNAAKPTTPPPVRTAEEIAAAGTAAAAATAAAPVPAAAPAMGPGNGGAWPKSRPRARRWRPRRRQSCAPMSAAEAAPQPSEPAAPAEGNPAGRRKKADKTAGDAA